MRLLPNLCLVAALGGCVTANRSRDSSSPSDFNQPASPAPSAPSAPPSSPETPTTPTPAEQQAFVRKHTQPGTLYGEAERRFVAALPATHEPGSVTEAAVAIAVVRAINEPAEGAPAQALDQLAKDRGVDLAVALGNNPLLQNAGFSRQLLDALRARDTPTAYRSELMATLRRVAAQWRDTLPLLDKPETTAPTAPPTPGSLREGESPLADAQALADRGDYKGALERVRRIRPGAAGYDQVEARTREISDQAVQALRRRAAEAFANSRQVADPRSRANYLRQAKGALEEAINDYPQASTLPTVRDNLRMVTRELEALEKR